MDDDAQSGVHEVTADDVPFDDHWMHWSTVRTWPIHLAVAWAAYPSRTETVRQGQTPTRFPREREARADVIAALIAGRLVAYGVPDPGMPSDPVVEIPVERWRGLALRDSRTLCEPALEMGGDGVAFRSVEVETSRLFGIWPDMDQRGEAPATATKLIAPAINAEAGQTVQMVRPRKADDAELHAFIRDIQDQGLTRPDVLARVRAHFGPRAPGETKVLLACSRSYPLGRAPGDRVKTRGK